MIAGIVPKSKSYRLVSEVQQLRPVNAIGIKKALFATVIFSVTQVMGQAPAPDTNTTSTENDADTPNRAVARISIMNGVGSVRRGESGEDAAATVNAPLPATDRLLTGEGSR